MASRLISPFWAAATAFLAMLWLGLILGVSFLATPIKFMAPSLDLAVALDVGRVTFSVFSKVEWVLSLLLMVATLIRSSARTEIVSATVTALILALQAIWLLPALEIRIEAIISGTPLPPSFHHTTYASFEAAKVLALASIAFVSLFKLGWHNRTSLAAGST